MSLMLEGNEHAEWTRWWVLSERLNALVDIAYIVNMSNGSGHSLVARGSPQQGSQRPKQAASVVMVVPQPLLVRTELSSMLQLKARNVPAGEKSQETSPLKQQVHQRLVGYNDGDVLHLPGMSAEELEPLSGVSSVSRRVGDLDREVSDGGRMQAQPPS